MTEPHVWVLIGVFAAAFFSLIGILTVNFNLTMGAKFETIDAKFSAMDAKFDAINVKLDHMDRDIQALSRQVFGTDPR